MICVTCGTPALHRQGPVAWCAEHTPTAHYRSCTGFCTARRRDLAVALAARVFLPPPPAPTPAEAPKRADRDLVDTLVAMVRRAANEMPGRARKDLLEDLEALLRDR